MLFQVPAEPSVPFLQSWAGTRAVLGEQTGSRVSRFKVIGPPSPSACLVDNRFIRALVQLTC